MNCNLGVTVELWSLNLLWAIKVLQFKRWIVYWKSLNFLDIICFIVLQRLIKFFRLLQIINDNWWWVLFLCVSPLAIDDGSNNCWNNNCHWEWNNDWDCNQSVIVPDLFSLIRLKNIPVNIWGLIFLGILIWMEVWGAF